MMHLQQTDLSRQGYVFSTVVIAFLNLVLVLLLLSILTHNMPKAIRLFLHCTGQCYAFTGNEMMRGADWARETWWLERKQ
jgi:hypothetical protein